MDKAQSQPEIKEEVKKQIVPMEGQAPPVVVEEKKKEPEVKKFVVEPKAPSVELSKEKRVCNFLEDKDGYFKMNDFLKSLYPLPTQQEPPRWLRQDEMKALKGMLIGMVNDGLLTIKNDAHLQLGKPYYEGEQQLQKHYNLTNIIIEAKI